MAGRGGPKSKGFGVATSHNGMVSCPRCGGTGHVEPDGISIGDRFKAQRDKMGLIQAEASAKMQIGRAQLANIEGDRSRPGIEVLLRAADVFGVTIDYLLGRAP